MVLEELIPTSGGRLSARVITGFFIVLGGILAILLIRLRHGTSHLAYELAFLSEGEGEESVELTAALLAAALRIGHTVRHLEVYVLVGVRKGREYGCGIRARLAREEGTLDVCDDLFASIATTLSVHVGSDELLELAHARRSPIEVCDDTMNGGGDSGMLPSGRLEECNELGIARGRIARYVERRCPWRGNGSGSW